MNDTIESLEKLVKENIYTMYLPEMVAEIERLYIREALHIYNGNASKACQLIGIHRNSINTKIKQYKLQGERKYFKHKRRF